MTVQQTKDNIDRLYEMWRGNYGDDFYTGELSEKEKQVAAKGAASFCAFLKKMQHVQFGD